MYGLGASRGRNSAFVCINHKTGKTEWAEPGFTDYASVISMGDTLLIHGSRGAVTLLKATPTRFTQLATSKTPAKPHGPFPSTPAACFTSKDGLRDGKNKLTALKLR